MVPEGSGLSRLALGAGQRRALFALLVGLLGAAGLLAWRRPAFVDDPQPVTGARAGELQSKIDPNHADAQTLAALPGVGEKRARAIVAYRVRRAERGEATPFKSPRDLLRIDGIGAKLAAQMEIFMAFPRNHPTTAASPNGPSS